MTSKSKQDDSQITEDKLMQKKEFLEKVVEADSTQREAKQIIDGEGYREFAEKAARKLDRRSFLKVMGGAAATLGLLGITGKASYAQKKKPEEAKRFTAAYCALSEKVLWPIMATKAIQELGEHLGFEFKIFDAELNIKLQRDQVQTIASHAKDYDVVFIQPGAIGAFTEPCKEIISKGVPLVAVDTKLTDDIRELDILTYVEVDHIMMGEYITEELCKGINYEGGICETMGMLTHWGAQLRHKGFDNVVAKYPKIEVLDQTPCDFSPVKTRDHWNALLTKFGDRIKAGMFCTDDDAVAAQKACEVNGFKAGAEGILIGGCDAVYPVLEEFKKGREYVSISNPPAMTSKTCLWAAFYLLARGESASDIPFHQYVEGPRYHSNDPLIMGKCDSGIWQSKHYLI